MIILLILGFAILIGIACIIISKFASYYYEDTWETIGAVTLVVSAIFFIICIIPAISIQMGESTMYEIKMEEYEMLNYRLENQANDATLYSDIMEFNSWILSNNKWANNPFTNVWNYQSCTQIPTIDYQRGD